MSGEHDFEPIRGLPGALPRGESILWQGAPSAWRLMARAFHGRTVGLYFFALLVWRTGSELIAGAGASTVAAAALGALVPAALALGLIALISWLTARTTVYTITNRRLVMRFGLAIPKAINIPFAIVNAAAVKSFSDRSGDVSVTLSAPHKVAYLMLWPHARPWRLARPEPTLRGVEDVAEPAAILADALAAYADAKTESAAALSVVTPAATPALAPA
jgi:hypothetical protein